MKNILIYPDIHGRLFWKRIDGTKFDRVIFLGDYLDPYPFDGITTVEAIHNFKEIIDFKKSNSEKVILLLGNHDMPYFSEKYKSYFQYLSRYSYGHHKEIEEIFNENRDLFGIAYSDEDILFTHAGCSAGWIEKTFTGEYKPSLEDLVRSLNNLLKTDEGLSSLSEVSGYRGGYSSYGSCIWADVDELKLDHLAKEDRTEQDREILEIKQIFGHTLQGHYDLTGGVIYDQEVEFDNCKMLDTANPYLLNTQTFEIEKIREEN